MATQWANVCAATLGQVRCGVWPGICATKAKKQLTNEYFAGHKRGKSKGFCLFVCATKYFCAAIAHKRERVESFLISLKEIATMQVDLTQAFAIFPCQLSIYSVYANKPELLSIAAAVPINI